MSRVAILASVSLAVSVWGCAAETEPGPEITRDEARAMQGKSDHIDLCEWLGWYDDGICDEFCPLPDGDCDADECVDSDDCPQLICVASNCPFFECIGGECVADDPGDDCPAGERECAGCDGASSCVAHDVPCPTLVCPPPATECGGPSDISCPSGEFCLIEVGICGNLGGPAPYGTCTWQPPTCLDIIDPVCGCDGLTYESSCEASSAGQSLIFEDECTSQPSVCGEPTDSCMNPENHTECLARESECPGFVLILESCPLQFRCPPPSTVSVCGEPTDACMNAENHAECLALEASCPGEVVELESCPLQFRCD